MWGHHEAHVGVELDQEPVLQHPDHHLNELGLQGEKGGVKHLETRYRRKTAHKGNTW